MEEGKKRDGQTVDLPLGDDHLMHDGLVEEKIWSKKNMNRLRGEEMMATVWQSRSQQGCQNLLQRTGR